MNLSFSHKVALITGAARGIGLATARAFAMSGANVVMADIDEEEVGKAEEIASAVLWLCSGHVVFHVGLAVLRRWRDFWSQPFLFALLELPDADSSVVPNERRFSDRSVQRCFRDWRKRPFPRGSRSLDELEMVRQAKAALL